jgi:HSP20 family protein
MLPILRHLSNSNRNVSNEIDRFFGDFWRSDFPIFISDRDITWTPRMDVKESEDVYILHADLPGLKQDDVKITLHDRVLTVSGERKHEADKKDEKYHYMERTYGSFQRSFTLPSSINGAEIKAEYKDGVLNITLPKTEDSKPREIAIS